MSSFAITSNEPQHRTQRRLLFEGFNIHDPLDSSRRHQSATTMLTSTPDHKSHEREEEHLDLIKSNDSQTSESCLLQLQNARQILHSMSRTNVQPTNDLPLTDDQLSRPELFSETNPELAYYKSSLESERSRRKQLETLVDVQQQRITETESELIQLRANDHKKTICMKQLEQMIPNVVDEWKQKETDYKAKLNNLTQQIKQTEQTNRDKLLHDKQHYEEQLTEKTVTIERLTKDQERIKQDHESVQTKIKQQEQRVQQLTKDAEQAKQRYSTLETDLQNELKTAENHTKEIQYELEKKQQDIEQLLRDQHKSNVDHQVKVRQSENELDEQRRENNVLKMELELREAKYRAQTESLKIQMMRDTETKLAQRLEEQQAKHIQIEDELNQLHRRKLTDVEGKYEQILSDERHEYENRIQTLLNKLDQMKNELERLQSTTMSERQDLARKLQDVFETALLKGSTKTNFQQNDAEISSLLSGQISQTKSNQSQPSDTQIRERREFLHPIPITNNDPTNMSTIRSLSSRIDSLVDNTNRVANSFEFSSRAPFSSQQETHSDWIDNNQNRLLSSQPHSTLHSPFFRSTPIDPMQDWLPSSMTQPTLPSTNLLSSRSHSADPSSTELFSTFPTHNLQQQPTSSFSVDNHLHLSQYQQQPVSSYRSTSSLATNFIEHQQEVRATISKDSIENQSSTNESLARYVKMLLERSPTQDKSSHSKLDHPLAKTNRSLHDIRLSIDQFNLAERDSKTIVDDLAHIMHNESHSPRVLTPRQQKSSATKQNGGRVKKRLDYDVHNSKQTNSSEVFERLSQPKTRAKKDKLKPPQPPSQASASGQGVWK